MQPTLYELQQRLDAVAWRVEQMYRMVREDRKLNICSFCGGTGKDQTTTNREECVRCRGTGGERPYWRTKDHSAYTED